MTIFLIRYNFQVSRIAICYFRVVIVQPVMPPTLLLGDSLGLQQPWVN